MQYVYWGSLVEERDGMRRDGCLEGTPNWRIARFGWGVFVERRDFCFGGMPNWRIARFGWDVFVEGRDFCFEGTRNWRGSAIPLVVFLEFVGRMIYIQAGQSLTSRACSTVGGAN